jgi:hypothetical protein
MYFGGFVWVPARLARFGYGGLSQGTTYTVGVAAASMLQGGMYFGGACHVASGFASVSYGSV